jgi:serine/threonine-protein phosphatase 2B catalytic subunit
MPNITVLREALKSMRPLPMEVTLAIIAEVREVLHSEPNLLVLNPPIFIAGDIHGQFYDLLHILERFGDLINGKGRYLFLGDYVDRGNFSFETLLFLLALKLRYPDRLFLLRGNHESRGQTATHGFRKEVEHKYNTELYDSFCNVFNELPIAAVVGNQYFCVHGGIAPLLKKPVQLETLDRFQELIDFSLIHNILWSDPHPKFDTEQQHFPSNDSRRCSYYYTYEDVAAFLSRNNLKAIVRSHSVYHSGYRLFRGPGMQDPSVFSIFSAPCYSGSGNNKGGILWCNEKLAMKVCRFDGASEPFVFGEQSVLFDWLVPAAASRMIDVWNAIWNQLDGENQGIENWQGKITSLRKICSEYGKKLEVMKELNRAKADRMKRFTRDSEVIEEDKPFLEEKGEEFTT